jgi:acyl dehydratase
VDLRRLLHAGQRLDVHRPIPVNGAAEIHTRVSDVWDKGSAAVVVLEHRAFQADTPLWTSSMQIWVKGEGGFGGHRGPDEQRANTDGAADITVDSATDEDQALLYRLNGDMNPLHIDPEFARTAGVGRPILHGLASLGIVAKAIIDHALDGQAHRLTAMAARFAGVLRPGETIRTQMWCDGGDLSLRATCAERPDEPVLTRACAVIDGQSKSDIQGVED